MVRTLHSILRAATVLLLLEAAAWAEKPQWNEACPSTIPLDGPSIVELQRDLPDYDADFWVGLDWPLAKGKSTGTIDAEELALFKKVITEVFRPGITPAVSLDDKIVTGNIRLRAHDGNELDIALAGFRVKTDTHVIQFLKASHGAYLTIRPTVGKELSIPDLANEVFNDRILPPNWVERRGGWYHTGMARESRILTRGSWVAKDDLEEYEPGKFHERQEGRGPSPKMLPLGIGRYREVRFYTDKRFVIFTIGSGEKR